MNDQTFQRGFFLKTNIISKLHEQTFGFFSLRFIDEIIPFLYDELGYLPIFHCVLEDGIVIYRISLEEVADPKAREEYKMLVYDFSKKSSASRKFFLIGDCIFLCPCPK